MSTELLGQFEAYKKRYPDCGFLHESGAIERHPDFLSGKIDWSKTAPFDFFSTSDRPSITPVERAIGKVLYDIVCLTIGAWGVYRNTSPAYIDKFTYTTLPQQRLIMTFLPRLKNPDSTSGDIALVIAEILFAINSSKLIPALWQAFTSTLTGINATLYTTSAILTIYKLLQYPPGRAAPDLLLALSSAITFFIDVANLPLEDEKLPSLPRRTPIYEPSMLTPNLALQTPSNNYVTFIWNGGYGGESISNPVVQTDRRVAGDWEKFTLLRAFGPDSNRYYIKTHSGLNMYAVNGGDMGGPDDTRCPIHTDADKIGINQKLICISNSDGTFSLMTSFGYFLTAMQGGGVPPTSPYDTIATDGNAIDQWFEFVSVNIE